MQNIEDPKAWITGLVDGFIAKSPLNNLQNKDGAPAWDEALVGFVSGADPSSKNVKKAREAYEKGELPPPSPPLA